MPHIIPVNKHSPSSRVYQGGNTEAREQFRNQSTKEFCSFQKGSFESQISILWHHSLSSAYLISPSLPQQLSEPHFSLHPLSPAGCALDEKWLGFLRSAMTCDPAPPRARSHWARHGTAQHGRAGPAPAAAAIPVPAGKCSAASPAPATKPGNAPALLPPARLSRAGINPNTQIHATSRARPFVPVKSARINT